MSTKNQKKVPKITANKVFIDQDTLEFCRFRKSFYIDQVMSLEENGRSDIRKHTDAPLVWVETYDLGTFLIEMDFDTLNDIWDKYIQSVNPITNN